MTNTKLVCFMTLSIAVAFAAQLAAQVQTVVPPVVAGAKPVTVERIKVHGSALEGNLEGDAVARDVIVFLPPSFDRMRPALSTGTRVLNSQRLAAERAMRVSKVLVSARKVTLS